MTKTVITIPADSQPVAHTMTPMDLMAAAMERGVDADQLEKLLALQERYEANQARKAFAAAMADFQAACPTIKKSRQADRYTYAPLDEILRTIRTHLDSAGLSVRFSTQTEGSVITAVCIVSHRDGHSETSQFAAPVDPNMRVNETQKMGSANSYAKRYALMNALNLVASEYDDDGQAAGTQMISDEDAATIRDHIDALEIDEPAFLKYLGVESVEDIPQSKLAAAKKAIERKHKQNR